MSIRTRIDKLETVFHLSSKEEFFRLFFEEMTYDEQQVYLLRSCQSLLQDPDTSDEARKKFSEQVEHIETAIREMSLNEKSPECARHFEECRGWWQKRGHTEDYVPALMMCHFNVDCTQDWHKPNLMQRRLALRANSEIQALRAGIM